MEKYKTLVIEDESATLKQLAKVIRKEGFEVAVAENGSVGLDIFKNEHPDIIVTDLKMPDIDGLEVLRQAKRISPNVPVILITGFGETDTAISALREGMFDYIKKPIDLNLLILALGRAKEKVHEYKNSVPFPNILLVDDEETTRRRLARVLTKEGWQVHQASDGEQALNIFKKTKIDIVLTDIKMPKKDGLQALHEMRANAEDFEAIILTGYGDESSAIQAMKDGAINFLKKPIDLEQMIVAVEKAIEKIKTDRALKYRTRELELAKQIIAKITAEKDIVIDVRGNAPKAAKDLGSKLLDAMPIGLIIVDRDMNIRYMNSYLARENKTLPKKIDEDFINLLAKIGSKELSIKSLQSLIVKQFDSPKGTFTNLSVGKEAFLTLSSMKILDYKKEEEVVLLVMRI